MYFTAGNPCCGQGTVLSFTASYMGETVSWFNYRLCCYCPLYRELAYLLYIMIRLQKSFGDDVGSNLGRITTLLSLLFTFLVMAFGLFPHQETFDNDVPVMYTLTYVRATT